MDSNTQGMNELTALRDRCLACRKCEIGGKLIDGQYLSNVFSNMNLGAKIMVVGQNPGHDETVKGEPFVGVAGKIWDEASEKYLGLTRKAFYIANAVRCWTLGNRCPIESEVENCREFLDREIEIINPTIIIALGRVAFSYLTGMTGIMRHHGRIVSSIRYRVPVMPILHPSPLNTNNPEKREEFYNGLKRLREFLDAGSAKET